LKVHSNNGKDRRTSTEQKQAGSRRVIEKGLNVSRSRAIAYWVTTLPLVAELGLGGVWDLLLIPYVRELVEHLGYPEYFLVILGLWKLTGAVALLVSRFPRLKEWAYAGAFFTYTGAVASHLAVGDGADAIAVPIIFAGLTLASWALCPSERRAITAS
jgi:DoxX-like protein